MCVDDVSPDAVITDPPYSSTTHRGHNLVEVGDGCHRRSITYDAWGEPEVVEFVEAYSPRTSGWMVVFSDDVLAPIWKAAFRAAGRYVFAPLPFVEIGSRVRMRGDGPSSWTCWVIVARPRTREMSNWGTLPGAYVAPKGTRERIRVPGIPRAPIGLKSQWVMRELVRHYTRPGALVVDPCAGSGSTLLAAAAEGRRAIGAEMDPTHLTIARYRIAERGATQHATGNTVSVT